MPYAAVGHSASAEHSASTEHSASGSLGQSGRFQTIELRLGDCPLVEQVLRGGDLVGRIAPSGNLLNVGVAGLLSLPHLTRLALRHSAASGNEVNKCGEERDNDQGDHPKRLPPSAQFFVTKEIANDMEQDHQVHDKEEAPDEKPKEIPKIHVVLPSVFAVTPAGAEGPHQPCLCEREYCSPVAGEIDSLSYLVAATFPPVVAVVSAIFTSVFATVDTMDTPYSIAPWMSLVGSALINLTRGG
jgi:hypothetical protein